MVIFKLKRLIHVFICIAGIALANSAAACTGNFYVTWMESEPGGGTDIFVKSTLLNSSGTNDQYGSMSLPVSALGGDNTLYLYNLITAAAMNNTKLRITTDDTDCTIDSNGENLGTIEEIEIAND